MLSLNISCPVCKVAFKSSDAIYSTSCGHIFHFYCMNEWKAKSTSCPQCRSYNPTTHSIYLNFDDSHEYEKVVNNLNAKLESSKGEIEKLHKEMDKREKKMDDIKRLYNISEQWRAELQDKMQHQNENHSKEIETLKTHMETMEKDRGVLKLYEKINEFSTENLKLKKSLTESETAKIILNQKLEMQEQRLKYVTAELQTQFAKSLKEDSKQKTKENVKVDVAQSHNNLNGHRQPKRSDTNRTQNPLKERKMFELTQPSDSKIVIKDFPSNCITHPLETTVIVLASKMSITLAVDDISKVSVINQRNVFTSLSKINLLVEFKSVVMKIKFLTNRNRLKYHMSTRQIQIKEYIDEVVYPIFMYANKNLRNNGYEYIGCKDNKVFAKKKIHDTEEIVIKNKDDVDLLLGKNQLIGSNRRKSLDGSVKSLYNSYFNLNLL